MARDEFITRTTRPPFFVVAICASLTLAAVYNSGLPMPPRAVTEAMIVLLPLVGLVISHQRVGGRRFPSVAIVISASLLIVVALAAILNGSAGTSMLVLLAPALLALSFATTGGLLAEDDLRTVARWIVILGVCQAVLAFAEAQLLATWAQNIAATNGELYRYRPNLVLDGIGRASGTMGHPILLGLICAIAAILTLNRDVVRSRPIGWALFIALAYGVVLSGSRSSVAALIVGTLVYFLHPKTKTRRSLRILIVLALIPTMVIYISEAIAGARSVSIYSLNNRLDALPRFLETLNRPIENVFLGEGENFSLNTVADNQFLTTIGVYGLIGFLILVSGIIFALFSRRPTVTATVMVLAFMALSFDVLEWGFSSVMFWLLVGLSHGGKLTGRTIEENESVSISRGDGTISLAHRT